MKTNRIIYKKCSTENCIRMPICGNGMCKACYEKWQYYKIKDGTWNNIKKVFKKGCIIEGCIRKHWSNGYCNTHYTRVITRKNIKFITEHYFRNDIRCEFCKKQFKFCQMDGHHKVPEEKEFQIAKLMVKDIENNTKYIEELDKCIWLCARCHLNSHYDPTKTYEETIKDKKKGRRKDRHKAKIIECFGNICKICNDKLLPKEMEFHHKDPLAKEVRIAEVIVKWSWDRIKKEVEKCDILCRNCHRLVEQKKKDEIGDKIIKMQDRKYF